MTEPESIQMVEEDHKPTDYHLITKAEWKEVCDRMRRFESVHDDKSVSLSHLQHEIARLERWNRRYLAATWFTVFFYPSMQVLVNYLKARYGS